MSISAINNLSLINRPASADPGAVKTEDEPKNNSIFANTTSAIQANTFVQMKNNLTLGSTNSIVSSAPPLLSDLTAKQDAEKAEAEEAAKAEAKEAEEKQALNYLC